MSKAFTKEDETGFDSALLKPQGTPLPDGAKNYMTPRGAERIREEFDRLLQLPQSVQREAELRIRYLRERLNELKVINPQEQPFTETVRFGATVSLLNEEGEIDTYQIVGVDEAAPSQGRISWIAPLASALLGAKVGDVITFRTPKNEQELEIVGIKYKEIT